MTLWQWIAARFGPRPVWRLLRLYPPFLGAGVEVSHISPDLRAIEVKMPLHRWTRNYVGTHFGGSLYAMCDPFYMLIVIQALGPDFVVWDKSASIDFLKPGRGTVTARFEVTDEQLATIRAEVDRAGKSHPRFEALVRDDAGEVVARVGKLLSVRRRAPPVQPA
jgi:acyl-coenzyme A thioesterase PaaI-like protein